MSQGIISVLIIVAYLCMMLVISLVHSRRAKSGNAESFFLAGRGVSSVLLPLTMIAAMQSTFAFLGAPGMYYSHGVSYIVIVLSQVWVAMMVIYFGNKIRKLAVQKGYMSLGDYLEDRYQSKYMKVACSLVSVLMTMVFLAMQYVGNARAMSIVSNNVISYNTAIIINVLFSLAYVLIGGAGGVVMLDAIQAIILLVGIVVAAVVALVPTGGIVSLFQQVREIDPSLLSRPGAQGMYTDSYWFMQFIVLPFGIWLCPHVWTKSLMAKDEKALARSAISIPVSQLLIFGFSTLFIVLHLGIWLCPHVWTKSLMAKDEKALARSAISIPVSQLLIFGFSTLFIGLAGHILIDPSELSAADNILPMIMVQDFNWVGAALIMAAAIAAGMSTINSMLLAVAQIMSQDLILINRKNEVSDAQNMRISRIVVLVCAVLCALIALDPPETLVQIVQDVAYTGLAQLAPPFILGLYWKDNSRLGAAVGLTAGIVILFGTRIAGVSPLGIPGFMWGFMVNILCNVLISLVLKNSSKKEVQTA